MLVDKMRPSVFTFATGASALLLAGTVLALSGCGQKGPLYLPQTQPEAQAAIIEQPAEQATEPRGSEKPDEKSPAAE